MERTKIVAKAVLLLSLVSSLTFGASELFAADPGRTCMNNGHDTLGTCFSEIDCNSRCHDIGGIQGNCLGSGCCFCEF
jgi:hypothetical protein